MLDIKKKRPFEETEKKKNYNNKFNSLFLCK